MCMHLPSHACGEYRGTKPLYHEFHMVNLRNVLLRYTDDQQTLNEIDANHVYYQKHFQKYSTINTKLE
eukprot:scaffold50418_cov49-Attheya_sp.AAC.1